jgi:lantibiotic modifying enzyme
MLSDMELVDISEDILFRETRYPEGARYLGIASGLTGTIICCGYLYHLTGKTSYYNRTIDLLNSDLQYISDMNGKVYGNVSYGLCGLALAIDFIYRNQLIEDAELEAVLEEFDTLLSKKFEEYERIGELDYLEGMGGIVLYFCFRNSAGKEILVRYLDAVEAYFANLEFASEEQVHKPVAEINMGVAHGLPGILLLLFKIRDHAHFEVDHLLRKCLTWILKCANNSGNAGAVFPSTASVFGMHLNGSGLSWSYGDFIIIYCLLKYSSAMKDEMVYSIAIQLLNRTLKRTDWSRNSLTICDGPVFIAHVLRRIQLLAPKALCADVLAVYTRRARHAFIETYRQFKDHGYNENYFENGSLLYGYPGALLSLICQEKNPNIHWDESMLF